MRIGVDVDGVLADFNSGFVSLAEKTYGITRPSGFMETWPSTWDYMEPDLGLTGGQISELWELIKASPSWWETLDPLPNAVQDLVYLDMMTLSRLHDVYFITTRVGLHVKSQTERWLSLMGFWQPTVLISKGDKGPIARGLDLNVLIDDKPENLDSVVTATSGRCACFLFSAPWNHGDYAYVRTTTVREPLIRLERELYEASEV